MNRKLFFNFTLICLLFFVFSISVSADIIPAEKGFPDCKELYLNFTSAIDNFENTNNLDYLVDVFGHFAFDDFSTIVSSKNDSYRRGAAADGMLGKLQASSFASCTGDDNYRGLSFVELVSFFDNFGSEFSEDYIGYMQQHYKEKYLEVDVLDTKYSAYNGDDKVMAKLKTWLFINLLEDASEHSCLSFNALLDKHYSEFDLLADDVKDKFFERKDICEDFIDEGKFLKLVHDGKNATISILLIPTSGAYFFRDYNSLLNGSFFNVVPWEFLGTEQAKDYFDFYVYDYEGLSEEVVGTESLNPDLFLDPDNVVDTISGSSLDTCRIAEFSDRSYFADLAEMVGSDNYVVLTDFECRANAYKGGRVIVSAKNDDADKFRVFSHELGHAVFNLADEYVEESAGSRPNFPNCAENDDEALDWAGVLFDENYVPKDLDSPDVLSYWSETGVGLDNVSFKQEDLNYYYDIYNSLDRLEKRSYSGIVDTYDVYLYGGCSYAEDNVRFTRSSLMNNHRVFDNTPKLAWGIINDRQIRKVVSYSHKGSTSLFDIFNDWLDSIRELIHG